MSGDSAWSPGEGVGSSRRCAVRASPKIKNAHQPPKRGERRDVIISRYYEAIEDLININNIVG